MSTVSLRSLEVACIALEYSSGELRKMFAKTRIADLKTAADAQDAARKEIREFIAAPAPVTP
jgi:hypothetical protein